MKRPRIAIAANEALLRGGMAAVFRSSALFITAFEADSTAQACAKLPRKVADVLILEVEEAVASQALTIGQIKEKCPGLKIIMLAGNCSDSVYQQLIATGINGILVKTIDYPELFQVIEMVIHNKNYFDHPALVRLISANKAMEAIHIQWSKVILTGREKEILVLLCEEMSSSIIGEILFLSERTVEDLRSSLLEKTGSENLAGLMKFAIKMGHWQLPGTSA